MDDSIIVIGTMLHVEDSSLLNALGNDVVLGGGFAFVKRSIFDRPAMAWVRSMLAAPDGSVDPKIISLLRPGGAVLPGAKVQSRLRGNMQLAVISSDKRIYRAHRDAVHLLAVNPRGAKHEDHIHLSRNQQPFETRAVRLDDNGLVVVELQELPMGSYTVKLGNGPEHHFAVAEPVLAALMVAMVRQRWLAERLEFELLVESFGVPWHGEVMLQLSDRGNPIARWQATANSSGVVKSACVLAGTGPHFIDVQLVAEPSRAGRVMIAPDVADQQGHTVLTMMGQEVLCSLRPSQGSRAVGELHMTTGASHSSPLSLRRVDGEHVELKAEIDLLSLKVVVVDPRVPQARAGAVDPRTAAHPSNLSPLYRQGQEQFKAGNYERALALFEQERGKGVCHPNYSYFVACCHALRGASEEALDALALALQDGWVDFTHLAEDGDLSLLHGLPRFEMMKAGGVREVDCPYLEIGEALTIEVPSPIALIAVAAFVSGEPWEGWLVAINPPKEVPTLHVEPRVAPDSSVTVEVEAPAGASAYVLVKDARVGSGEPPARMLGTQLKRWATESQSTLHFGAQHERLKDRFMADTLTPGPRARAGQTAPALHRHPLTGGVTATMAQAPPLEPEASAVAAAHPAFGPDVLFAGIVPLVDGRGAIQVEIPAGFADYVVEVFSINGFAWASNQAHFRADKVAYTALELPRFVHPADVALASVHLSGTGRLDVELTCNGESVPLFAGDRESYTVDTAGDLGFEATPGVYRATVRDVAGAADTAQARVSAPGTFHRVMSSLRLLQPGDQLNRGELGEVRSLRVLPGLERPFRALALATANYEHGGCEQTAAKIVAAVALQSLAESRQSRRRAEAIMIAAIRRLQCMWLAARGFKLYPHSGDTPSGYWGARAARYLRVLQNVETTTALRRPLAIALEMAHDSCNAYGISWTPLVAPNVAVSCQQAYAVLRFNGDAFEQQRALSLVAHHASEQAPGAPDEVLVGGVGARTESAYAAAAFFRAGGAHLSLAVRLANQVLSCLDEERRLYSTVDSVAAIALMNELRATGMLSQASAGSSDASLVAIDGVLMRTSVAASKDDVHLIAAHDCAVLAEVTRVVSESWEGHEVDIAMHVDLETDGRPTRRCRVGQVLVLRVALRDGYRAGDVLRVCLPRALGGLHGSARIKDLSVDLAGQSEIRVPLIATSSTVDIEGSVRSQRFAVCLRNMFEQERISKTTWIDISVA